MSRLNKQLDPALTGLDAEKLEVDLKKRIVGQDEAIYLRESGAEDPFIEKRDVGVCGGLVARARLFDIVQLEFDMLPL